MLKSEEWARDIRREIIEASHDVGRLGVHIGSALSAADVLAVLYADVLNYDVKNPRSEERDYFVLSKGHAYIGYYAALAKAGFFSNQDIKEQFMTDGGWLPVHPVKNLDKGIEFSGGSLGTGMPFAVGKAYALKLNEKPNKSISKRNSFKNMDNNIYLTTTKNERKISKYNSIKINNNHINNNHIKGKEKPIEKNIANSIINKKLSKKNSLLFLNKKNKINIFFSQSHMNFYKSNINNSIKQKIMDYNAQTFNNLLSAKLRNKKIQTPKMNFYQNSLKYNNFYNRYNNLSQKIKNNYSHDMASNNSFQKEEEFY